MNTLYYGDNLPILREHIKDESVDLIYLDPPFNSSRSYNVLFKEESGQESESQITAFEDAWHWNQDTERTYQDLINQSPLNVADMISSLRSFIGPNQMMAYLVMMTVRLVELHRVLKITGSLYLHCDTTACHYLKIILDTIFGIENFRNEIVWKRQSAHSDAKNRFPDVSDIILFYAKTKQESFVPQYGEHDPDYLRKFYRFDDHDGKGLYRLADMASPNPRPNMMYKWMGFDYPPKGWRYQKETMQRLHDEQRIWYPTLPDGSLDISRRLSLKRYLNEQEGSIITNIWTDIQPLHSVAAEHLGYPTQKPLALLERIIQASSIPGEVVLDPFCGCGTAVIAAEKLNRQWIGIDVTHLAITLIKYRLRDSFPGVQFEIIGEPQDLGSANQLAHDNRYQFQWWALSLVEARPYGGDAAGKTGKKGKDTGIDGVINFIDDNTGKPKKVMVQVKSGHVKSGDIRDLRGVLDREESAVIGVFITLEEPSSDMLKEAATAGFYTSTIWQKNYPRIQILTIPDLLAGVQVDMPPQHGTFKQAPKTKKDSGITQKTLGI